MITSQHTTARESDTQQYKLFPFTLVKLALVAIFVGFVLRIILLFNEQTLASFSTTDVIQIFMLGIANDILVTIVASFFLWLIIIFVSNSKYKSPWGYIILAFITIAFCYVTFFNTIFHEYGSSVSKIVRYFLLFKLVSFAIRLFVPKVRARWSTVSYFITFSIYILVILTNAVGEYLFWDEFGVRYNFIAVDYLVYTHEVIGNIMESYPIVPLLIMLFVVSATITYFLLREDYKLVGEYLTLRTKLIVSVMYFILFGVSCFVVKYNTKFQHNDNVYVNEMQANGVFKFYTAFMNSELDYNSFYITLPMNEATAIINKAYNSEGVNNKRIISDTLPEVKKNIVLITVESLSASFLARYGNTENITPNIDSLMNHSLVFNNLFAAGNRTVRGLEALTLSLPPSPGESVIKRPNNSNLFSTGKLLKDKGYTVQYLYGGDSYFDNMETFFSGNGYEVIDKKSIAKEDVTFSNIWGVCDEDMFAKALAVFDENATTNKPFFGQIMTVSNHRPFTYPEGKIDIPTNIKSRNGGVKYTDYAIGKFINEARGKAWFDNTVFVIVADHCASSAGKTQLPLDKYHIPALIYAPQYIEPQEVNTPVSQIDLMPTLFGLLNFSYESQFYGQDILSPTYKSRALIATYQSLGYWEDSTLTILSPVERVEQFEIKRKNGYDFDLEMRTEIDSTQMKNAIANYETVKFQLK